MTVTCGKPGALHQQSHTQKQIETHTKKDAFTQTQIQIQIHMHIHIHKHMHRHTTTRMISPDTTAATSLTFKTNATLQKSGHPPCVPRGHKHVGLQQPTHPGQHRVIGG